MNDRMDNIYIEKSNEAFFGKYGFFARNVTHRMSCPLHFHDYYELEYIAKGSGTHIVNGSTREINEGTLYMVTPRDIHRIDVKESMLIYTFFFDADLIPNDLARLISSCSSFISISCPENMNNCVKYLSQHIINSFSKISEKSSEGYEINKGDISGLYLVAGTLLDILIKNGKSENSSEKENRGVAECVQNALRFINKNFRSPLSLEKVAEEVGYSKSHFSRVFTKYVGCNFIDYVKEKRLKSASLLLRTTEMNVTDIAFSCGYGSISQFIRDFKTLYAASPGDYRKDQKNRS